MAGPRMLSTKLASLRETPCASATALSATTAMATATATAALFDRDFIIAVTAVTGVVERLTRGEQRLGVLLLRRTVRLHRRRAHRVRHADPVATVTGSSAGFQQVGRLDERHRVATDDAPFAIVLREHFLGSLLRHGGGDGVVDRVRRRRDHTLHDLLHRRDRRGRRCLPAIAGA